MITSHELCGASNEAEPRHLDTFSRRPVLQEARMKVFSPRSTIPSVLARQAPLVARAISSRAGNRFQDLKPVGISRASDLDYQ